MSLLSMKSFRDLPLQRKATLVILSACVLTVLAACGGMAVSRVFNFHRDFERNLRILGRIIADQSAAPIAFGDDAAAREILSALGARPDVRSAALQKPDGSLLAAVGEPLSPADLARFPQTAGHASSFQGHLFLGQPVLVEGHSVGRLLLRADYQSELYHFLRAYVVIVLLVLAGSAGLALLVSASFQRVISGPILKLVAAAARVAQHQDYSVRVPAADQAELGLLTGAFNQMLARIEEHNDTMRRLNLEALHQEVAERRRTEAALRQSEARLKLALAGSRMGVWDWNLETNAVFWSPECYPIMGVTEFEGSLEAFTRLVHPEDVARVTEDCRRAISEKTTFAAEFRIVRPNGAVAWVSNLALTIYTDDGQPLKMVGIVQDITERKCAETAVEERLRLEERLSRLAAAVPGALYTFRLRPDGSTCLPYASPAVEDIFGAGPEAMLQDAAVMFQRIHPDDLTRVNDSILASARAQSPWQAEFRVRHPRKGEIWVEGRSTPERELDGSILWHGFIHDITGRKQIETALRENEEKYRRLFDGESDSLFLIEKDSGLILEANLAASRLYGYSREELLKLRNTDLSAEPAETRRATEEERQSIPVRFHRTKDGRVFPVEITASHFHWQGRAVHLAAIRDITERQRAETALRDRETELDAIYENAPIVMLLVDGERRICKMNQCAQAFARTNLAEAVGRRGGDALRCLHALESPEGCGCGPHCGACTVRRTVLDTLQTGRSHQQVEATLPFAVDGERRDLTLLLGTARLQVQGQTRVLVTLQDVTALKQTQEALRRSEAFTRTVLDNLPLGIAVNSVDPAVPLLYVNDSFLQAYRLRREQLTCPDDFWNAAYEDPVFRAQIRQRVLEDCASGDASRMVWRDVPITRQGQPTTYICARNIPLPDQRLMISTVWDVTERKHAEEALRRSEEMFRLITENAAELVALVDAQGRRRYNSPSYRTVLGYAPEDLQTTSVDAQIHPEDQARIRAATEETLRTGCGQTLEYRMQHADGSWRVLESSSAVVRGALDGEDALLTVARDITARKAAEAERAAMQAQLQQAQKLESLGRLAAGIAHEINTPTQYIGDNNRFLQEAFADLQKLFTAYGQLLQAAREHGLAPEVVETVATTAQTIDAEYLMGEIPTALGQSLEGVERVAQIVRAMKDFSHPGSGAKTAVDLNRALESTLTVCRNEWKYVAEVVTDFDPSPPPVVCLPGEVNQVFLNLIVNAAHAIADVVGDGANGKGTITVRTRQEGEWFEIRIADTGAGIPENIRDRLFEPFFTTKPVGKGTGQGLALARSVVVDKHGGTIAFESEVGRGTTFIIRLPLAPPAQAESKRNPVAA
jgi:PAS domain S-box-containing protein